VTWGGESKRDDPPCNCFFGRRDAPGRRS
jgi:hypothetical protein